MTVGSENSKWSLLTLQKGIKQKKTNLPYLCYSSFA